MALLSTTQVLISTSCSWARHLTTSPFTRRTSLIKLALPNTSGPRFYESGAGRRRTSRLDLMDEIIAKVGPSLHPSINIGSKKTSMGDVKVDINGRPDVKGSALSLPFKSDSFSLAIFTEVLEHLPRGSEIRAIQEISRILKEDGVLVMSTPASQGPWGVLYRLADPAFWLIDHRHYKAAALRELLESGSLRIETFSRRGGPRDMLFSLVTPFIYLLRRIGYVWEPNLGCDYSYEAYGRGYTFVVQAKKLGDREISRPNLESSAHSTGNSSQTLSIVR